MGKQSNLGPFDPQFGGASCAAVVEEFEMAQNDIKEEPLMAHVWQNILSKYPPTFVGECQKALELSDDLVRAWLQGNMFHGDSDAKIKADKIVGYLGSHQETKTHARHVHIDTCRQIGIKVIELEGMGKQKIDNCDDLQDCLLTLHHAYMHTFETTAAYKIVENQFRSAMIRNAAQG